MTLAAGSAFLEVFMKLRMLGFSLLFLCPAVALASLPVNHKSEGCVIKG